MVCRDMKRAITIGSELINGIMITKRTSQISSFTGSNISSITKSCICRNFNIGLGDAFHQFHFLFAKESGQHVVIHVIRKR